MMKFESTERLNVADRLRTVSNEIIEMYPKISSDNILKIAGLCDIVSDKVNSDIIFRRYYYILFVIQDDEFNFDIVYNDMIKLCTDLKDELNIYLYNDIIKFANNELNSFPMISDYYGEE